MWDQSRCTHKLNTFADARLVKQKKIIFGIEKQVVMRLEVDKLVEARFFRKVAYPKW